MTRLDHIPAHLRDLNPKGVARAKPRNLEAQAQKLLIARCNDLYARDPKRFAALSFVHHSPGESYGGPRVRGVPLAVLQYAAMCTRAGVPDILCFELLWYGDAERRWLALELKIAPNVLSD